MFNEPDEVIQIATIETKYRVYDPEGMNIRIREDRQPYGGDQKIIRVIGDEMRRLCLDKTLTNEEKAKQLSDFVNDINEKVRDGKPLVG